MATAKKPHVQLSFAVLDWSDMKTKLNNTRKLHQLATFVAKCVAKQVWLTPWFQKLIEPCLNCFQLQPQWWVAFSIQCYGAVGTTPGEETGENAGNVFPSQTCKIWCHVTYQLIETDWSRPPDQNNCLFGFFFLAGVHAVLNEEVKFLQHCACEAY